MSEFKRLGFNSATVKRMVAMLWETRRNNWSEDGVEYTLEEFADYYFRQAPRVCSYEYIRDMWVRAGVGNLHEWQ